jgi:hypothetical protein
VRDGLRCEIFPADLDVTVEFHEDVVTRPWGLRDCRLLDPDGYYWRITTR